MDAFYPVYTQKNECNDCYKCIRGCHVKAIRISAGSASVINEKCIVCGECVKVCPAKAKTVRSDLDLVKSLILSGKKVYVSLAPTWKGVYSVSSQAMVKALMGLGFAGVSETALGAQEVSIQTANILNSCESGLFISSACPVIDNYIRLYKPDFANSIVPLASPALTHAAMLKESFGKECEVVFIGPCIAKKTEADAHPNLILAALTFEELNYWLKEEFIEFEPCSDNSYSFLLENSHEGSLYPIEGGMNETIRRVGIKNNDVTFIQVSSLADFDKALQNIDLANVGNKIFVEALSCSGGCINGPSVASGKSPILITNEIYSKTVNRNLVPTLAKKVVKMEYSPKPILNQEFTIQEISKNLKKIGKHKLEDELNCSACGYTTCREFVNALIQGDAEASQCASYMRKIAVREAAEMLRCMPSSVVIVNSNMQIVKANDAFERFFLDEETYKAFSQIDANLEGASIQKIVPFPELFKACLERGQKIHHEHYVTKFNGEDKIFDISIFSIEENELVGAVISDVTKSEIDRSKIVQKAKEVISKNISTVQEIASLLGEHMVETELILESIAQDYGSTFSDSKGK